MITPDSVAKELDSAIFDFLTDKNLNSDASASKFQPYSNGSALCADAGVLTHGSKKAQRKKMWITAVLIVTSLFKIQD
ncbi:hypothetical protein MWU54_04690 [Marivita sp. S6314]|nr:hypothetical protein [Marivita sp. S6314]